MSPPAAASLKNALDDAAKLYQAKTGDKITISCRLIGAGETDRSRRVGRHLLLRRSGMDDYLEKKKLDRRSSRHVLLGNTLVLVAPKDSTVTLPIEKDFALVQALGPDGKLAMAGVDSVPAGKQEGSADRAWGLGGGDAAWCRRRTCAALAFRRHGRGALGIVHGTDAKSEFQVRVVGVFPEDSHPKILYPAALTASADPEARKFLDFLLSAEAAPAFEAQGFSIQVKVG
jgi:molybdate transport system substrate-binding protein